MAKKPKPAPSGASQAVCLQYADILAMSQDDRIGAFKSSAETQARVFITMGKLHRAIEAALEPGQAIFRVLQDAGIKKGTVSNASYAAKVYDLVQAEKLTEEEFDTFTFQDCVAIQRAQAKTAKRQLTADEVVAVIRNTPGGDFAEDLNCYYEHGCTQEEKTAAEARAKEEKERAKAEAEARQAQQKADLEAEKARNEQLKRELEAAKATNPTPATEAPAPAAATPAPAKGKKDAPAPAPTPAAATTAAPTAEAGEVEPEAVITEAPPASAAELIALLTDIELAAAQLPADEQSLVAAKLTEMAERFTVTA